MVGHLGCSRPHSSSSAVGCGFSLVEISIFDIRIRPRQRSSGTWLDKSRAPPWPQSKPWGWLLGHLWWIRPYAGSQQQPLEGRGAESGSSMAVFRARGQQVALWKHVNSSLLTCSRAILYLAEVVEGLDCPLCSCPTLCLFSTSFSTKAAMTCTAADES